MQELQNFVASYLLFDLFRNFHTSVPKCLANPSAILHRIISLEIFHQSLNSQSSYHTSSSWYLLSLFPSVDILQYFHCMISDFYYLVYLLYLLVSIPWAHKYPPIYLVHLIIIWKQLHFKLNNISQKFRFLVFLHGVPEEHTAQLGNAWKHYVRFLPIALWGIWVLMSWMMGGSRHTCWASIHVKGYK